MTESPTSAAITKARTFETGDDEWENIGRALRVPATARNLNTVRKLIDLAGD